MSTLDNGMLSLAYLPLAHYFNVEISSVLWISVAFWITTVGLMHTLGWMGDVFGRKRIYIYGLLVFTIGIMLAAVATNLWVLIFCRVIQAFGAAIILSTYNAFITAIFPSTHRGRALGWSGAIIGIGLSLGPLIGGVLLEIADWKLLFYSRVPIGILAVFLAWYLLPDDSSNPSESYSIDIKAVIVVFITLGSALILINQLGEHGTISSIVVSSFLAFLIFLPLLIWMEKMSKRPILNISLLKIRQYRYSVFAHITHYLAQSSIIFAIPLLLLGSMGFSATKVGLVMASFSVSRIVVAPIAGRLSDQFGARYFLVVANCILGLGLVSLSFIYAEYPESLLWYSVLFCGLGASLFEPVVTSTIMGSVPQNRLGTASASVGVGRQFAFAVGTTLSGAVYAFQNTQYTKTVSLVPDGGLVIAALGDVILVGVIIAFISALLSFKIENT
jgi:EmrB/QacA subfamily drug resistance transporter